MPERDPQGRFIGGGAKGQLRVEIKGLDTVGRALAFIKAQPSPGLWQVIGGIVESQTRRRLNEEKTDPEGNPWKSWSMRYAGSKHGAKAHKPHPDQLRESGGHSLLVLEGHLRDSIEWIMRSARSIRVGSDLVYARRHQHSRPYIGMSTENEKEVIAEITKWLEEEIPTQ
jgi:hypothetical protein